MMKTVTATVLLIIFALASAMSQTLPQSTVDRQTIAWLQYQLTSNPLMTSIDRLRIQEEISELQYRINTRPAIETPRLAPPAAVPVTGAATMPTVPLQQPSCASYRATIEFFRGLSTEGLTKAQREYLESQAQRLMEESRRAHCP